MFQTIKSKDAWNSPEDSNFPRRDFVISHVDKTKQQFFCEITASHGDDSASKEVVALFEQVTIKKTSLKIIVITISIEC